MPTYGIVTAGLYAIHLINIQHITHNVQLVVIYPSGTYTLLLYGLYVCVILIILLLHLDDDCVGNDAYWRSPGVPPLPQTNVSYNKSCCFPYLLSAAHDHVCKSLSGQLDKTETLCQSTGCPSVQVCSARADELKSASFTAPLCSPSHWQSLSFLSFCCIH